VIALGKFLSVVGPIADQEAVKKSIQTLTVNLGMELGISVLLRKDATLFTLLDAVRNILHHHLPLLERLFIK
jgi:hypothetical protein